MGRPLKFKSVEQFERLANEYFDKTPDDELTITGLALYLHTTRDVLNDYEQGKYDEYFEEGINFSTAIKQAKEIIHQSYEKSNRKRGNAGDIFALKNFNWSDKQDINMHHSGEIGLKDILGVKRNTGQDNKNS